MRISILGPAPDQIGLQPLGDYFEGILNRFKPRGFVKIAIAYAQASGWVVLERMLRKILQKKNVVVDCIFGIDDQGTSEKVVKSAVKLLGIPHVFLFHNPVDETFHLKFFLIKPNLNEGIVIIGSSNMTEGGLLANFELNIVIELDLSQTVDCDYFSNFENLFEQIRTLPSSLPATDDLVRKLSKIKAFSGTIQYRGKRSILKIRKTIRSIFPHTIQKRLRKPTRPTKVIKQARSFLMTLAYNDVSGKRIEPYILIPLVARDRFQNFWGWPNLFIQGTKYMERRFQVKVRVLGTTHKELNRRLYFVPERSEFRLTSETIYRQLGNSYIGSIVRINWEKSGDCQISIITPKDPSYASFIKKCQPLYQGKRWGYI